VDLPALATALVDPFVDPASRTWWGGLVITGVIALVAHRRWSTRGALAVLRHPSTRLDLQLYLGRILLDLLLGAGSLGLAWLLATHGVRRADALLGRPPELLVSDGVIALLYTAVLFLSWDASRFALHWLLHRVPALWAFHQVHHSAEVLTPLSFHRLHPVESWLYRLRGALVTGVVAGVFFWLFRGQEHQLTMLGVPAVGLVLNAISGNLRHSQLWLPYPAWLERWLISPAQHQLHHSAEPAHFDANYGTWLAIWDRLAGTLLLAERPPARFGLPPGSANHGHDLLSAWLGPFRGAARSLVPLCLAVLLVAPAHAGDENEDEDEDEASETSDSAEARPPGEEIIVTDEDGTPRVAGSAHVLGEETLSQYEFDDIEKILGGIPGVSTRGEDGHGLRPNIGIRGANSDRSAKITLMEDGVLLSPAPYAAPAAYYFPMSTRMVAIEVFKGPAATRHGPHTVGGAINLQTRAVPDEPDFALDLAGGLRTTGKAHVWAGTSGDRFGLLLEGVHLGSAGFKELDGGGDTGFDRSEFMAKGSWTPSTAHHLQLKLGVAREHSQETYLGLTEADAEATPYRRYAASALGDMRWTRTQAELSWSARVSRELRVRTVAYHHYLDRSWFKLNGFSSGVDLHDLLALDPDSGQGAVYLAVLRGEEDGSGEQALMIGANDRRLHSGGVQSTAHWERNGNGWGSQLELGLRLHIDQVARLHTERAHDMVSGRPVATTDAPLETLLDADTFAQALAVHAHEDLRLDRLHLIPGLRLEAINTGRQDAGSTPEDPVFRTILLPGFGTLYEAHDSLDLFAGAYRGFSPVAPGQPEEVAPEQSWNIEAGLRAHHIDTHVEVVGFLNDYVNLTGQCTFSGGCTGASSDQQYNGGRVLVGGFEASAGAVILLPGVWALPLDASYALTQSAFQTGFSSDFSQFGTVEIGDRLPYSPLHQGAAHISLQHPVFDLGVGLTARSGMLDAAGDFDEEVLEVPGLLLLDAAINVHAREWLTLYATGTNLTQSTAITSWRPFGARPTPPLQVMVGAKVRRPRQKG